MAAQQMEPKPKAFANLQGEDATCGVHLAAGAAMLGGRGR